jgi:hypothetical protein
VSVPSALPGPLRKLAAARDPSPSARRVLLAIGAVGFVVAMVLSLRALDVGLDELAWGPLLLVVVVLAPLTILGNAAELKVMATGTANEPLPWGEAVRVVVLATAANLLPIPGAALVRIQALRTRGATAAAATGINIAGAGAWLGTGLVVAGVALVGVAGWQAAVAGGVGLAGCTVTWFVTVRSSRPGRAGRTFLALLAVELLVTVLYGVRLLAVLAALRVDLELLQALVIALSAPLSAAAGVFPSGIGLAEGISGLLAPLVAVPVAAGVAATGVNRIAGLAVTAPLAMLFAARAPGGDVAQAGGARPAHGDAPARDGDVSQD